MSYTICDYCGGKFSVDHEHELLPTHDNSGEPCQGSGIDFPDNFISDDDDENEIFEEEL
jgi:hypothetical protein